MPYNGECTEMLSVFSHQHFTLSSYYAISKVMNTNFIAHFVCVCFFFLSVSPLLGKEDSWREHRIEFLFRKSGYSELWLTFLILTGAVRSENNLLNSGECGGVP